MITQSATAPAQPTSSRQLWIDQLRTAMIFLVVNMHACCTYSHVGGWYVTEGPDPGLAAKIPFFFWQAQLQAFFMGLLFFLGGHFAQRSLARKNAGAFLRDRFVRLMVPSLLYMLVIHPFIVIGLNPYNIPASHRWSWLGNYYLTFDWVARSGPLWFAIALFVFCAALVLWRKLSPAPAGNANSASPSGVWIAVLGAAMVLGSFLIRTVQPIGTNILNFQLCFFPQYILVFAAGVLSARQGWLERFSRSSRAAILGWLGLLGGPALLALIFTFLPPTSEPPALFGGWNLSAFLYASWEQLVGLATGIGCLALFSRFFNWDNRVARWLNDNSFGVYVLHAPVLVWLLAVFAPVHAGLWPKVLLMTATGLALSYALSAVLRALPGMKRVL